METQKNRKAIKKWICTAISIIMAVNIFPFPVSASQTQLAQVTPQENISTNQSVVEMSTQDTEIISLITEPSMHSAEQITPMSGASLVGRVVDFSWGTDDRWPGDRWTLSIPSVGPVTVGSFRYDAQFDGAVYEAWCIDPHLGGPEQTSINYAVLGALPPTVAAAARVGYPNNARITDSSYPYHYPTEFIAYMTRLAITVAARPGTTIESTDPKAETIYNIARGEGTWHNPAHFVPARYIQVNGVENAIQTGQEEGNMIVSAPFNLTNSHSNNPIMFRWQPGTPVGTQLIINGTVEATAPALPANNSFNGNESFRLAVPQDSDVDNARVEIVGIHDDYADQAWYARTQVNPEGWQVIAFYIPRVRATAGFTFEYDEPTEEEREDEHNSEIVVYKREVSNGKGNNQLLAGATFRIQGYYPALSPEEPPVPIDRVATTGTDGRVVFSNLPPGHFTITEIQPPTGYLLGENNVWAVHLERNQTVALGTAQSHTFFNVPKSSLEVLKVCGVTNEPLAGAVFELSDPTTGESWQATSGTNGIAVLGIGNYGNLLYPNRTLILREIVAPEGFVLLPETKEIVLSPGNENRVTIENWRNPGLRIIKMCQDTGTRLAGAHFTIEAQGSGSPLPTDFPLVTNENGEILVPWTLFEGESERTFIITETVPPPGFHLSDPNWQVVTLLAGHDNTVVFSNRRMPTLTINKTDSVTGAVIQGAEFSIERLNPAPTGKITGNPFITDAQGNIVIENLPAGVYRVIETRAAANYWLDPQVANRTWIITISENEDYLLQVENTLLPTLVITKMNAMTNRPIPLTHFRVEFEVPNSSSVQLVGNFVTDDNGQIILPFVQSGWYRITETRPASGMALSTNNNHRVFLNPGDNTYRLLDFINSQDSDTPSQSEPQSPNNSSSDNNNTPHIHDSSDDSTDEEIIGNTTGNMQVTDGDAHLTGENIWNWPLNSIVIKKTDATTGQLLQGATFELIHVSSGESGTRGTVIGRFTTNHSGIIVITGLEPGTYVVEEAVPPPNYTLSVNNSQHVNLRPDGFSIVEVEFSNHPYGGLLITKKCESTGRPLQNAEFRVTNSDGAVVGTANGLFRTNQQGEIFIPNLSPGSYIITEVSAPNGFELNSTPQTIHINASGQIYRVEFTNRPLGGLQIIKLNSVTRQPIRGVEFAVTKINGERVGTFRTNNSGIVNIRGLEPGWYTVVETRAADGYFLDSEPRNVEVVFGTMATLEVLNTPMSGIRVRKIDAVTREPIFGVEFMLFDSNNRVVERFTTDNNGVIDFFGIEPGRYTIRETRAAAGYYLDEVPKTVEFVQGRFTEIVWENTPQMGQIQILKLSGDDNQVNGLPAGTPLAGAVFEVSDFRTGNVLDRFVSGNDGRAVSRPLPLGRYLVREVQAPQWYMLSTQVLDIVIEFPTQIIRHNFLNYSANTGVIIRKTGNQEAMPGDSISYAIREMRNTSTVPLTDFYWRDVLPTDAVRLSRIVTGTYNQALKYRVVATTNRGETITLADNLSTMRNNVIDTTPVALGLRNDEFITSFTFIFGTVQAGFTLVEQPQVFVNVLQNLPNDYQFANRVDVGGKYGNEWVISNSAWVTTIFAKPSPLPRTGW